VPSLLNAGFSDATLSSLIPVNSSSCETTVGDFPPIVHGTTSSLNFPEDQAAKEVVYKDSIRVEEYS